MLYFSKKICYLTAYYLSIKLFCLYREQRDSIKMYKIGQEALLTEIKITSTKALRIKKEIKRSLSQRCDKIWQCALEK